MSATNKNRATLAGRPILFYLTVLQPITLHWRLSLAPRFGRWRELRGIVALGYTRSSSSTASSTPKQSRRVLRPGFE